MKILRLSRTIPGLLGTILTLALCPAHAQTERSHSISAPHVATVIEGKWTNSILNTQRADFESDDLPLSEAVKMLTQRAQAFDVILPNDSGIDVYSIPIRLRLKNVSIVEVFQAMNLQFELNGKASPYRWALIMNNDSPTAVLEILPPSNEFQPPSSKRTVVMFVGDLIGNKVSFSEGVKKITTAIDQISAQAGMGSIKFSSYPDGELLVVTGSENQINLVRDTLAALARKTSVDRVGQMPSRGIPGMLIPPLHPPTPSPLPDRPELPDMAPNPALPGLPPPPPVAN